MLKEIQCNEFHHSERIPFKCGLNAIIGNESGTNSVGKSTFLMILDFVFGGTDYIEKAKEVHRNIDPHRINFMFEFEEGQQFFFSRSTEDPDTILICNDKYEDQHRRTAGEYAQGRG